MTARPFVLIASARTGSNQLAAYINQIPRCHCLGEIIKDGFTSAPHFGAVSEGVADPAEAVVLHRTDIGEFWNGVVRKFAARDIWVGPKVLYDHRAGDPIWETFFDPSMPVIHLWRRRILDSFISLLIAEATDEWMSQIDAPPDRGPQAPIVFPVERYLRYRKSVQDGFRRVKARTASHEKLLQVEYAEIADPEHLSARLSAFFGAEAGLKQTLRKQNTRPPGELLANPEAIAPFLQDRLDEDFAG